MNPGERLNNNQDNQESAERKTREENINLIWHMPVISILVEMGISGNDIKYKMNENEIDDLRVRLEERLAEKATQAEAEARAEQNPDERKVEAVTEPSEESTVEEQSEAQAEEEGPAIVPPVAPAGVATGEETGVDGEEASVEEDPDEILEGEGSEEAGESSSEEADSTEENPADVEADQAETPTDAQDAKPEKKRSNSALKKRIGAAVLTVITATGIIMGSLGMFQKNDAGANKVPTIPPAYEQMQEEVSYEFEAFDGTDYRGLFLNEEGNGYNEEKQSLRYDANLDEWVEETSWKYDISPRVLDEQKLDWEAGDHETSELSARHTIFNQLVREPEFLAIVANQFGDEDKERLGLDGITTVQGMETALENPEVLAKAESALAQIFEHDATGEFTTFTGYATNYYLRSNNESNIQNDSGNIEAARTATRHYSNVDVFIIHMTDGSDVIFDIDCLNVVIPVEEGTPDEEVEPGTPIITIEIDEPTPETGSETGTETGEETGDETGNETGDETGNETGDETGNETGDETGNETGDETGNETGNETGDETGNETGTETGTETGNETGNEGGLDPKDPEQIEDNMRPGDETTNDIDQQPAGEETDRPDTESTEYNEETNQFEDTDTEPERPAEDIQSEDGSGDTVAEVIDNADQEHADDTNLTEEDQQASEDQTAANEGDLTGTTPEMTDEQAADWFNSQFGNGQQGRKGRK